MWKTQKRQIKRTNRRNRKTKLDILNQSRERDQMPRPTMFRDRKKYDRNLLKDAERKGQELEN